MALYSSLIYTEPRPSSTLINFPEPAWCSRPQPRPRAPRGCGPGPAGAGEAERGRPRVERGVRAASPAGAGPGRAHQFPVLGACVPARH